MVQDKADENVARSELQNEILQRAEAASPKILKRVEEEILPTMESAGRFEGRWLDELKEEFSKLVISPNDPIGRGMYEGWTTDEIGKLYFVIYGENLGSEEDEPTEQPQSHSVYTEKSFELGALPKGTPDNPRDNAEIMIRRQSLDPLRGPHSIRDIEEYLQRAKDAGVDVSDLEAQTMDLNKKITRVRAEAMVQRRINEPARTAPSVADVERYFKAAKEAGVDVSDLEAQMPPSA